MKKYFFLFFIFLGCSFFTAGLAFLYGYADMIPGIGPILKEYLSFIAFTCGFICIFTAVYFALSRINSLSDKIRKMTSEISNLKSQSTFLQQQIPQLRSHIEALSTMREISRVTNVHVEFDKILEEVLKIISQMTGASVLDTFLAETGASGNELPLKARLAVRGDHGYFFIYFNDDPETIDFETAETGDIRHYTGDNFSVVDTVIRHHGMAAGAGKVLSRPPSSDMKNLTLYLKESISSFDIDKKDIRRAIEFKNIIRVRQGRNLQFTVPLMSEKKVLGVIKITIQTIPHESNAEIIESMLREASKHISLAIKKADLYERAVKDGLTNLYNKAHFLDQLNLAIAMTESDDEHFSLLFFDIDHFKQVNDTYGHISGDIVLKEVANILKRNLREHDMAFRYGGEELAIILSDAGIRKATKTANRIRKAVKAQIFTGEQGESISVTVSIGVSQYYHDVMDGAESLISRADQALYTAKNRGRDRVVRMKKPRKRTKGTEE